MSAPRSIGARHSGGTGMGNGQESAKRGSCLPAVVIGERHCLRDADEDGAKGDFGFAAVLGGRARVDGRDGGAGRSVDKA